MYNVAFLDTGFLIRLLDKSNAQHATALSYFTYMRDEGYIIRMSTIAVAEYCVGGEYTDIPTESILLAPFNPNHAVKAGTFAKALYQERSQWVQITGGRTLVKNDAKLMAHAEADKAHCYVTFDKESQKLYEILKQKNLVTFDFWDANEPLSLYTGRIIFDP